MNLEDLLKTAESHEIVVNLYPDYCSIEVSYMMDRAECSEEFDALNYKEAYRLAYEWAKGKFNGDY